MTYEPPVELGSPDTQPWNFCLDCESILIPCTCRADCPGAMCSNPKCNPRVLETAEQTAQRQQNTAQADLIRVFSSTSTEPPCGDDPFVFLQIGELNGGPPLTRVLTNEKAMMLAYELRNTVKRNRGES